MKLHIANDFSIPAEAVTQTFGILAKKRAGKSYTARKLAEQLFAIRQQIVIIDPKGDWWGIRSSSDGKKPGLPITILGGEHGDLPLENGAGEVVARLAVVERASLLLDLSDFRKSEVASFMAIFLETLYRLKARDEYRTPMMLLIDEADAIAPQKPFKGEERMLGAAEDIVRRGGQRGIGCTMVSQRSAVLNKNILTQIQILIALRTISPQDRDALNAWIDVHGTPEERKTLMDSLASLPTGDAWFWSPGWPTADGIFRRVHVAGIETFDSGATPKPGETRIQPKNLADVDLEALRRQMSETIERAKRDDPKELRRRIADLERQIATATPISDETEIRKEAARAVHETYQPIIVGLEETALKVLAHCGSLLEAAKDLVSDVQVAKSAITFHDAITAPKRTMDAPRQIMAPRPAIVNSNGAITGGLRRMMIALAQRPAGLSKKQIGVRAGLSSTSGTFGTYLGRMRSQGWIDGSNDLLRITEAGLKDLGDYDPLPTGRDLLAYWLGELGKSGAARMLEALASAYPKTVSAADLGEWVGMSAGSGTFGTYLGKLRTLELIEGSKAALRASEELF